MSKVSIVVPCYNHGKYIHDAIRSVEQIADRSLYELIIVDDGSTDEFTRQQLQEISRSGYNVIFQENQGLSASRNNAIKVSSGEYILPLDSDNKIRPEYVYKGIEILDRNKDVDIVYGNRELFGDTQGKAVQGAFNLQRLMITNFIDACAMFRKEVWVANKGYDTNMRALEDWEFWLNAAFKGYRFHYIDEVLFDYRVLAGSMVRSFNAEKTKSNNNMEYMISKHAGFFGPQYIDQDIMLKFGQSPLGFMGKLILKKYFPQRFNRMVEQGKLRRYI